MSESFPIGIFISIYESSPDRKQILEDQSLLFNQCPVV